MAAPKGNNFAYANPHSGRPTTWTKEIIEQEAELLIEWCQRDDAIVLREFAPLRGYAHGYMYRWADPKEPSYNEVFCEAFDYARSLVGARREKVDLNKSTQRDLAMHFDKLDEFEKQALKFKSDLIKNENKAMQNSTEVKELAEKYNASKAELAATKAINAELKAQLGKA